MHIGDILFKYYRINIGRIMLKCIYVSKSMLIDKKRLISKSIRNYSLWHDFDV